MLICVFFFAGRCKRDQQLQNPAFRVIETSICSIQLSSRRYWNHVFKDLDPLHPLERQELPLGGAAYGGDCMVVCNDWHSALVPMLIHAEKTMSGQATFWERGRFFCSEDVALFRTLNLFIEGAMYEKVLKKEVQGNGRDMFVDLNTSGVAGKWQNTKTAFLCHNAVFQGRFVREARVKIDSLGRQHLCFNDSP